MHEFAVRFRSVPETGDHRHVYFPTIHLARDFVDDAMPRDISYSIRNMEMGFDIDFRAVAYCDETSAPEWLMHLSYPA